MMSAKLSSRGIMVGEAGARSMEIVNAPPAEVLKYSGNINHRNRVAELALHRRHRHIVDSARDDVRKRREIAANIQSESMHRDPMPNADADRSDLALMADPNASESIAARADDLE